MQVKRLIELLSELDQDANVYVGDGDPEDSTWNSGVAGVEVIVERTDFAPGAVIITAPDAPEWSDRDEGYEKSHAEGWKAGVEHGKTADYKAAYADGYDVGVEEARRS